MNPVNFSLLAFSRQLLLVVAPDWDSGNAQLQRYRRAGRGNKWQLVGEPMVVSLGKAGLAWGLGMHPPQAGPGKREGDARSPAGTFAISALFGYGDADAPFARGAKLPYLCATSDLKAIDDPASFYYNRIVDQSVIAEPDWLSCEEMLRDDQRYALGAVVEHNSAPVVAGAGSCIFLHVWASERAPTSGCTAMSPADMAKIAGWLDAAAVPLLVQLPRVEYERLYDAWGLPEVHFAASGDSSQRAG